MIKRIFSGLFAVLTSAVVFSATPSDLTLNDGRVLKGAKIVAIGDTHVSVIYAGGALSVHPDIVPLDALARASADLESKNAERKTQVKAITEREAAAKEKKQDEINTRLAEAKVRNAAEAQARSAAENESPSIAARPAQRASRNGASAEQRLAALKAKFPARRTETVVGYRGSQAVEIPKVDMHSYYKGTVQTATLQSLPISLGRMEERIENDLNQMRQESGSHNDLRFNAQQARRTTDWLNKTLRPYLAQLRAVSAGGQ